MDTKMSLVFLIGCFSVSSFALDEVQVFESGKSTKVYALENEVMVHSSNGDVPKKVRTDLRNTQNFKPGDKVSEIFSDGPLGSGRLRSLPGGVIVKFSEGVDPKIWASENNLTIKKELKPGLFLVSSPAGRKTLSKVNEIAELDGVESVEPNWWTNVESKTSIPIIRIPASIKSSFKR